jgi:hypothetical protein
MGLTNRWLWLREDAHPHKDLKLYAWDRRRTRNINLDKELTPVEILILNPARVKTALLACPTPRALFL